MAHPVRILCALSLAGALLLASTPALACSCAFPPIAAAREAAAAVFEGRVLAISATKNADAGPERAVREVTLAVVRSWKGLDKQEQVVVHTHAESSLCGYAFSKGKSYLVFADDDAGGLGVNACSRTRPIAQAAEDLSALGAGATPVTIVAKSTSDAGAAPSARKDGGTSAPRDAGAGPMLDAGAGAMLDAGPKQRPITPPSPPPVKRERPVPSPAPREKDRRP